MLAAGSFRRFGILALALSGALSLSAAAADRNPLTPGEYITGQGWGTLKIGADAAGRQRFEILTVSVGNYCELSGTIENGRGLVAAEGDLPACAITLSDNGEGIDVAMATPAECKRHCGLNGSFDVDYLKVAPECTSDGLRRSRDAFKRSYDGQRYAQALATLEPVLNRCGRTLSWEDEGDIRNDLAITQYHNGRYRECLATLQPYAEEAALDDAELADSWPPVLLDRRLSIVRPARTNLRLCKRKLGLR
ncbi:hypothetical protein K4L06_20180 [Lysobacter sp. BMK333-48F3]|uniref:hypothetical protein n=1 Tax=Lysobacter sp. BMK333-48F3 TaxID=2867962 RepID=UPI001C8B7F82|nr:hypothetical protein [Lysobacter sp. BMK333-48F3]MBX9403634.1 hypothetical protein [Lysobacter sp. BMK333-48F3]